MTLTVESYQFSPAPEGTHAARLTWAIDLGIQETSFGDRPQALLGFELVTEPIPETDKNFTVTKFVSRTLARNSTLRTIILALTGKEPKIVNLEDLLGAPCLITVVHKANGDSTYANISAVTGAPKNMTIPEVRGPLLAYDMDDPDSEVYENLPEWVRRKISYAKPKDKIIIGGKNFAGQKPMQRVEGVLANTESEDLPF